MESKLKKALENSFPLGIRLLLKMEDVGIEIKRRAKLAEIMVLIGLEKDDDLIKKVLEDTLKEQRKDGGWGTIEESIICLRFISHFKGNKNIKNRIKKAISWLFSVQNKNGGWGRSLRDRSRIPITFRVVELFSDLKVPFNKKIKKSYGWMEKEWKKDISFSGLSYKASGILIANKSYPKNFSKEIIQKTLNWLIHDQIKDGGWGPNQYSPINSTSIYTSLVLFALIKYRSKEVDKKIKKGINWMLNHQLKGGQWKEHPPEDGVISCLKVINFLLRNHNYP